MARARPAGHVPELALELGDLVDVARGLVEARVRGIEAVDVGQEHEAVRADHLRDARREPVVVTVAQLLSRNGVVLVHDRNGAVVQQREQRLARVQIADAALAVVDREQHLRRFDPEAREHLLIRVSEQDLSCGRGGLAVLETRAARIHLELPHAERDRAR